MKNIHVFVVGGVMPKLLVQNHKNVMKYQRYKMIYVETYSMKKQLEDIGILNVKVIPNGRKEPENRCFAETSNEGLSCVFLSRITEDKGVMKIINVMNNLPTELGISVDFWGPIDKSIEEKFFRMISQNMRINYKGVFDSANDNVYELLAKYDVLLFPTDHEGEGFPGILTEAKIAGLPVIASDKNYNCEIVNNGVNGIILYGNLEEDLRSSLIKLYEDNNYLLRLRKNSFDSANQYFIESYIHEIFNELESQDYEN